VYLSVGFRFILVACVPYKCSLHSFMYVLFIVSRQHFGYILVLMFRIFETDIKILKNYMTLWRIKRLYKASAILTDNKTDILISGFIRISGCSWASLVSLSHSYNRNGYRQRAPKRAIETWGFPSCVHIRNFHYWSLVFPFLSGLSLSIRLTVEIFFRFR